MTAGWPFVDVLLSICVPRWVRLPQAEKWAGRWFSPRAPGRSKRKAALEESTFIPGLRYTLQNSVCVHTKISKLTNTAT